MSPTGEGHGAGKVILLGEHAVVHRVPGLAAGIARGARAVARHAPATHLRLGEQRVAPDDDVDLARAFRALLEVRPQVRATLEVEATAELEPGGGLGCSAALGVAIARAVERAEGREAADAVVLARAGAWEAVFHGNASGIDAAAAAHGGALRFVRGQGATPLRVPHTVWLAVAHTGRGASTRAMVEHVAARKQEDPEAFAEVMAAIEALVARGEAALLRGDARALAQTMDANHVLLRHLGVSTDALDRAVAAAKAAGALGAKLTGSGGGGAIIALAGLSPGADAAAGAEQAARTEHIVQHLTAAGFSAFATTIEARPA